MLFASLSFACMGVCVKLGAAYFSSSELVFYRCFCGLLFVAAMLLHKRTPLATPHWRSHLWRGLSGTIAMMLYFYCISTLPLASAITLNYTSAIFLTVLTLLVYKDRLHLPLTISLMLGFIGVVLLLHPTFERAQFVSGILGLASGFFAAIALMNVRQLGLMGEPAVRVVFYFNLVATLFSGVWMAQTEIHPVTLDSLWLLLGMGATATFAQVAMTHAYRVGQTQVVSTLSYSTIVFASLFGLMLWNEMLPIDSWFGIALIIGSGMLSLRLAPTHTEAT
ncbi:EamA-like transporter family protein [mine drainage metagenome]|uniref:EamA-like transporter family protein n=1 Tax=mine drainage metagenome TaxID=410659 RepID=A0A1J5T8W6_9ZZZZ